MKIEIDLQQIYGNNDESIMYSIKDAIEQEVLAEVKRLVKKELATNKGQLEKIVRDHINAKTMDTLKKVLANDK